MSQKLITLTSFLLVLVHMHGLNAQSPPGQPEIIKCRSYEKETFSCWWRPGSDGGLPTNYTLMYRKESGPTEFECPDYHTSGPNSCFFDKAHTSIWVMYTMYVKATNALGSNMSKEIYFDTISIVQTFPPQNVTLVVDADLPNLLVKWLPPEMADVKSGWLTLCYEVQLKTEKELEWESFVVDKQTKHKVYGLTPGETYVVRVRCRPDSGLWSEWSLETYAEIPAKPQDRDFTLWISFGVLSSVICLTMIWTMALKGCSLMSCVLPPVPGPKIMGFDTQLLKNGKAEDFLSALNCQGFPPTSDCEDLLVEFVEVDESKEHLITSQDRSQHMKVCPVDTDNDSGRGSCDSPFALSEGCKDLRTLSSGFEGTDSGLHDHSTRKNLWPSQNTATEMSFPNFTDNKSYVWPEAPSSGTQTPMSVYHNVTDVCKMAIDAMNANVSAFLIPYEDKSQPRYFRTIETINEDSNNNIQGDLEEVHSTSTAPDKIHLLPSLKPPFTSAKTMDYVEVHTVNQNNALALIPKHSLRTDQYTVVAPSREYSKVEKVEDNNVLVLMPDLEVQDNALNIDSAKEKELCQKAQQSPVGKRKGIISQAENQGTF